MPETGEVHIPEQSDTRDISPLESPDAKLDKRKGRLGIVKNYADSVVAKADFNDEAREQYNERAGEMYFQYLMLDKYISNVASDRKNYLHYLIDNPSLTRTEALKKIKDSAMEKAIADAVEVYDLEKKMFVDPLTGAWSRAALENFITLHMKKDELLPEEDSGDEEVEDGEDLQTVVMMLDIDHFKDFNDTYGHDVGDEVLKKFVKVLQSSVRGNDIVARYGGEEFSVVLPRVSGEQAKIISERIRENVERLRLNANGDEDNEGEVSLTTSIGVTSLSDEDTKPLEPLKRADKALYEAKNAGRNLVKFDSDVMTENSGEYVQKELNGPEVKQAA